MLEQVEETFCNGVAMTGAPTAHRMPKTVLGGAANHTALTKATHLVKTPQAPYTHGMRDMNASSGLPFLKMHGLGNDFVVLDFRDGERPLPSALVTALADRHRGVGFDQLAIIARSDDADVAADLTFYNADGSPSAACGNATRCIADHLMQDQGTRSIALRTERGVLACYTTRDGRVRVNMGQPALAWADIPLSRAVDTACLPIEGSPIATGMGNPHCAFFVEDVAAIDLAEFGPRIEHDPLFPERTNVQIVQVTGPNQLRMRVWERGTGITLASGSSSCAVAVAAVRRGLTERRVSIDLDGGRIEVNWSEDGVWMMGPTAHVFNGVLTPAFMAGIVDDH